MSRRRKISVVAGIVLGVALLIPVIHHYQLRFALAAYVAKLKAKGEPMDLAQVIPPPVPPEQNGAPLFLKAASFLDTNWNVLGSNPPSAMRMIAPGKAMIGSVQPDIRTADGENSWEEIGAALAEDGEALKLLSQITNGTTFDFNLDYKDGFDKIKFSHLAPLKRSAQKLSAAAIDDLHRGDSAAAVKNISTMLAMVNGESHDRILISELVRIAIAQMGVGPTWEVLQVTNISDEDLAQLQQGWQSLEFSVPLEQAMLFERFGRLQQFEQIRKSSEKFDELWGEFYAPDAPLEKNEDMFPSQIRRSLFLRKWDELRWRWFWSYLDELRGLQVFQVVVDATRMVETNTSFHSVQSFALATLNPGQYYSQDLHNYSAQSANALYSALRRVIGIEIAQNVVVTAIAIKRYELRHHQLPATLEELTPEFLPSVPIDCMDGQPLRYRPNADGTFLLYSVGENGVDDGGNPALEKGVIGSNYYWQNSHALDWVWPKPATEAEIQAYYQKISVQKN
jgi:hypothetical protein